MCEWDFCLYLVSTVRHFGSLMLPVFHTLIHCFCTASSCSLVLIPCLFLRLCTLILRSFCSQNRKLPSLISRPFCSRTIVFLFPCTRALLSSACCPAFQCLCSDLKALTARPTLIPCSHTLKHQWILASAAKIACDYTPTGSSLSSLARCSFLRSNESIHPNC